MEQKVEEDKKERNVNKGRTRKETGLPSKSTPVTKMWEACALTSVSQSREHNLGTSG
jgi:hypothetical protein